MNLSNLPEGWRVLFDSMYDDDLPNQDALYIIGPNTWGIDVSKWDDDDKRFVWEIVLMQNFCDILNCTVYNYKDAEKAVCFLVDSLSSDFIKGMMKMQSQFFDKGDNSLGFVSESGKDPYLVVYGKDKSAPLLAIHVNEGELFLQLSGNDFPKTAKSHKLDKVLKVLSALDE